MIEISYLQNIYPSQRHGVCALTLHRNQITDVASYPDFASFVSDFLTRGVLQRPATNKADAYGFCPTLFMPEGDEPHGVLSTRLGRNAADTLTLFVADLDNQHKERSHIDIDTLESVLENLGLSYLLYSSYSHTVERNKVRVVIPVSRPISPNEAFEIFVWFATALDGQLDGSIYDPGDFLYGPPLGSDVRFAEHDIMPVEEYLALSAALPDEARAQFPRQAHTVTVPATPEQIAHFQARYASMEPTEGVSTLNTRWFNPAWFADLDALSGGGSHWSTCLSILTRVWIKSRGQLSGIDLRQILTEIDAHWFGYMSQNYSQAELNRLVRSAMSQVPATPVIPVSINPTTGNLHAALNRMKKRKSK